MRATCSSRLQGRDAMSPAHTERTSTGLTANVAAAASYFLGFVTGIMFLIFERENRFVRFHAMQSTFVFVAIVVIDVLLQMLPILGALLVIFVVIPASAVLWLILIFKAYQGEEFSLPVVGPMAAERV
ncbi:MAG TPA: DUF4870 domain-containing protein [Vicinamibacterales bacterium]|jgi:uncharacterized membrane protein|nr:DUF4870 domain-containing protein [Vicinamibacterales bacterium]